LLKDAARNPSVNINQEKWGDLVAQVRQLNADLGERAAQALLKEVRVSPTLVKYAEPNQYEIETRREFQQAASELMAGAAVAKAPLVDLLEDDALEIELATTLLYQHSHYSYRQLQEKVSGLSGLRVALRKNHEELRRGLRQTRGERSRRRGTQGSLCIAYGLSLPRALQDGFRRGPLHQRAAHHARRALLLPQRRLCDVRES